ncbi:MAG: hypothetical protein IIY02_06945, partial [Firmicutes bacterium]|nr:hypothetical protein [Bacillota bacterium]
YEDYHNAEQHYFIKYLAFFSLATLIIFVLILLYSYAIRNISKMSPFVIDLILSAETPTKQFIESLPGKATKQKKDAIRKYERKVGKYIPTDKETP